MKNYNNFKEIEKDLKILSLEKQIALEELKNVKQDFQESLKPLNILSGVFKFVSKYGVLVLLKKIFK
jgi:hypothetical protein